MASSRRLSLYRKEEFLLELSGSVLYLRSRVLFHAILTLCQPLISGLPHPSAVREHPTYSFSGKLSSLCSCNDKAHVKTVNLELNPNPQNSLHSKTTSMHRAWCHGCVHVEEYNYHCHTRACWTLCILFTPKSTASRVTNNLTSRKDETCKRKNGIFEFRLWYLLFNPPSVLALCLLCYFMTSPRVYHQGASIFPYNETNSVRFACVLVALCTTLKCKQQTIRMFSHVCLVRCWCWLVSIHSSPLSTRWHYQPLVMLAVQFPSSALPSLWSPLQSCREYHQSITRRIFQPFILY